MVLFHIGVDDTDSPRGGCTTYVAALLVERLAPLVEHVDHPNLVRLNPNVKWKTRGNGAVSLRVESDAEMISEVQEIAIETVENNSDMGHAKTDPAIVFLTGQLSSVLLEFGERCLREVIQKAEALRVLRKIRGEAVCYGSGRGLVGALAAIGNPLLGDHTYEFLAYRRPENRGSPRRVDADSVFNMDDVMKGGTFSNVDPESKRVLITPRGPDPVLLGVRGESPEEVWKAFLMIQIDEEVERWLIFRTNQGTEAHLFPVGKVASIRPRSSVTVEGVVSESPATIRGRHVIFGLSDGSGEISVAAYEPSGNLRKIARKLLVGDQLQVSGGVRPAEGDRPLTINLEKLKVLELVQDSEHSNPLCPSCGRLMESMGSGAGYRCRRCGLREPSGQSTATGTTRSLEPGVYLPPPRSQRHLAKPFTRYGLERPYQPLAPKGFWGLGFPGREPGAGRC